MKRIQIKDRARFYAPTSIGTKRSVTPEGFLVCHDVPIARTGTQLYNKEEIPIDAGPDGLIRIERNGEEVFRDETIASFEGKAVTVEHPDEQVTPENWAKLAIGTVQNVRRGSGIEDDLLIADLVITDSKAIEYVNKELPEVSAGYEAEYVQTEPGRGLQRDIVGNHVALVERGRAGPRCSIQDKEPAMAKKQSFLDRLRALLKDAEAEQEEKKEETKDEDKVVEEKKEETKDEDGIEERLARIDAVLAKLIQAEEEEHQKSFDEDTLEAKGEEETNDDVLEPETAGKADVGKTYDSMKAVIARAEILCPGISVPTGDAIKATGAVEKLMRKALIETKADISAFAAGRDVKTLTGDALASVFTGAAELVRALNNQRGAPSAKTKDFGKVVTVADLNARNREFWAQR